MFNTLIHLITSNVISNRSKKRVVCLSNTCCEQWICGKQKTVKPQNKLSTTRSVMVLSSSVFFDKLIPEYVSSITGPWWYLVEKPQCRFRSKALLDATLQTDLCFLWNGDATNGWKYLLWVSKLGSHGLRPQGTGQSKQWRVVLDLGRH